MSALLPVYLVVKFAAYSGWCLYGLRLSIPGKPPSIWMAAGLGLLRLLMGVGLGLFIWWLSTMLYAAIGDARIGDRLTREVLAYIGAYVPTRWFEWAIIALVVFPRSRSVSGFFLGGGEPERYWRLCGIGLSCLAGLPMILSVGGLPLGRFFC